MKQTEQIQQRKLAWSAIRLISFEVLFVIVIGMVLHNRPTTLNASINSKEFSAEIDCEFASDTSDK